MTSGLPVIQAGNFGLTPPPQVLPQTLPALQVIQTQPLVQGSQSQTKSNRRSQFRDPEPSQDIVPPPTLSVSTSSAITDVISISISPTATSPTERISAPQCPSVPAVSDPSPTTTTTIVTKTKASRVPVRCEYWPNCINKQCEYIHPTIPCKNFPSCTYATKCTYIHPYCKFMERCANEECLFMHTTGGNAYAKNNKPCHYGASCMNKSTCPFTHEINQGMSWHAPKTKIHVSDRKFAAAEAVEAPIEIEK